jgi:phage shock protein A
MKTLSRDGQMTEAELNALIDKLADKKRPLDEIRDFTFAREAMKDLGLK